MSDRTSPTPLDPSQGSFDEFVDATPGGYQTADSIARKWMRANLKAKLFDVTDEPVRLGRFVILGRLGEGGMGVVYSAYDPELDRRVALKVLRTGRAKEHARRRLVREARALAQVSHPNVVQVYDAGVDSGDVFVAMEYVQGQSLQEWCSSDPKPDWQSVLRAYVAAARGLAVAHAKGLVHRDIKPANVLLGDDGRIRVADFGLARGHGESVASENETLRSTPGAQARLQGSLDEALTRTGGQMGTPVFMAPEQYDGSGVGPRADQYALCVALYEGMYQHLPFDREQPTWSQLYHCKLEGRFLPRPTGSDVPIWVYEVVMRGLSPEPDDRYPSMTALADALEADPAERRRGRRRTALLVALALLLLALPTWWNISQWLENDQHCADVGASMQAIWNPTVADTMRARFLATQGPYAASTATMAATALDEYARSWVHMSAAVCEVRNDRPDESARADIYLREACLERHRSQLASLVTVFTHDVDAQVVENALQATQRLPPISDCQNMAMLRARVRPPDDPGVRAQVDEYSPQVDRLEALYRAGLHRQGRALADDLQAQVAQVAYPPLRARAMYWGARFRQTASDHAGAVTLYLDVIDTATSGGDAVTHAHALVHLLVAASNVPERRAELPLLEQWLIAATRLADDRALYAMSLASRATVERQRGHYKQAMKLAQEALQIWLVERGPDHPRVASALIQVGSLQRRLGQYEDARATYERALTTLEQSRGPNHPTVARSLGDLSLVERKLGRYREALAYALRSLAILEQAFGEDGLRTARPHNYLGMILRKMGRYDDARSHYYRALAIMEQHLGPRHSRQSRPLHNLANLLSASGELSAARDAMERVVTIRRTELGDQHPRLAKALNNLAAIQVKMKDFEAAAANYQAALTIWRDALGPDHPDVAYALYNLGIGLMRAGKFQEAQQRHSQALAIRERAYGPSNAYVAVSLANLGLVSLGMNQLDAAEEYLLRARRILEAQPDADRTDLSETLLALSRLRLKQGRHDDAIGLIGEARAIASDVLLPQIEAAMKRARAGQ